MARNKGATPIAAINPDRNEFTKPAAEYRSLLLRVASGRACGYHAYADRHQRRADLILHSIPIAKQAAFLQVVEANIAPPQTQRRG